MDSGMIFRRVLDKRAVGCLAQAEGEAEFESGTKGRRAWARTQGIMM